LNAFNDLPDETDPLLSYLSPSREDFNFWYTKYIYHNVLLHYYNILYVGRLNHDPDLTKSYSSQQPSTVININVCKELYDQSNSKNIRVLNLNLESLFEASQVSTMHLYKSKSNLLLINLLALTK
jgi:hypothetical protein